MPVSMVKTSSTPTIRSFGIESQRIIEKSPQIPTMGCSCVTIQCPVEGAHFFDEPSMTTINSQAAFFNARSVFSPLSKVQPLGTNRTANQQSALVSPIRNARDVYVTSAPNSSRNTYLPPTSNKGLQNTQNQVSSSQFRLPEVPTAPSVELTYWTIDGKLTAAQYAEYTPREFKWADPWERHDSSQAIAEANFDNSGAIVDMHLVYDETGAFTAYDRDGNVLTTDERREVTVWDHLRAGRKQEFFEELEANPGLVWRFDNGDANKDFAGHDILNAIFPKVYESVHSLEMVTDEYGYTFRIPAYSPNENFTVWSMTTHIDGKPVNTIDSVDRRSTLGDGWGLYGLTLEERDLFYAEVQKIFDQNGVQFDARKESYYLLSAAPKDLPKPTVGCDGQPLPSDYVWTPFPGGWQWGGGMDWIDPPINRETIRNIQEEILDNSTLHSLFDKAAKVRSGEIADDTLAQQYSIRVTDNEGNRLANDRIIVEARNGNQVQMSVEQFSNMSRKEITALLR